MEQEWRNIPTLPELLKERGEKDGNVYRIWLDNLNGVCDISGHTDIMCAHLGEDDILTFQVNTPDDKSTIFVYLDELPEETIKLVVSQLLDILFPDVTDEGLA